MRKQQQVWLDEHKTADAIPSLAQAEPSEGLVYTLDFLKKRNFKTSGTAVDIGCGKGRNSTYLAKMGFEVYALDYIHHALAVAKELAELQGVASKIHFEQTEIDTAWSYGDCFFDFALDSYATIDIETPEGRKTCRDEMFRTLKPGGYALVTVVSTEDELEKEMLATHPGPELHSVVWPQNQKFQKDYDEAELREFYKAFEIVELKSLSKSAFRLGKHYQATNIRLILRKPE